VKIQPKWVVTPGKETTTVVVVVVLVVVMMTVVTVTYVTSVGTGYT
jgi:hypothetical protein